jgi:hypothetical protein
LKTEGRSPARTIGRIQVHPEGEVRVFSIELAPGAAVRPVDWRRFAYDHPKVGELLTQCVRDNIGEALFEPRSEDTPRILEKRLAAALADLSSVFDLISAGCETEPERITVTITGEHKNGERAVYQVEIGYP